MKPYTLTIGTAITEPLSILGSISLTTRRTISVPFTSSPWTAPLSQTVGPGLHLIVPFVEKMRRVDMREQVVDVPPQEVITKDNVVVTVDAVVYYQATDPVKLAYNVSNFILAATKLAQTNLRNVIGDMRMFGRPK